MKFRMKMRKKGGNTLATMSGDELQRLLGDVANNVGDKSDFLLYLEIERVGD